jgi:pyruvate-formate lyase-activating enzyme
MPGSSGGQLAIMITRRCNMTCGHCSVESSPSIRGEPSDAELVEWVRAAAAAGVTAIRLTGGEPMLRTATVLRLVRECRRLGIVTGITSNGFWGRTPAQADRHVRALKRAGLSSITLSYDRYHAEFQGPDPVLHITNAAERRQVPLRVSLVRGTDEPELAQVVKRLEALDGPRIRVYDLQPVGRARELPATLHRGEIDGFCSAASFPALTDDGRLVACNGPSYFEKSESPLVLGPVGETPLAELLERHRTDPILDTIRTRGPVALRDELRRTPGFEDFPFRLRYTGICELCHQITRHPQAVAALRERLGQPEAVATRLAVSQVIEGNRRQGMLSTGYVNGVGACRVFLGAAWDPARGLGTDAEHLLGRADVDWRGIGTYLCGSGLARPLLRVVDDPVFARWAPLFFRDELRRRGLADGMRELVQRDVIGRVAGALGELGGRGVLLKGAALLMLTPAGQLPRATSDVDILVDPALAPRLRDRLLEQGFAGAPGAGASTFQHLEPITFQGVAVEIHTRLMPDFWGLPERAMIDDARPLGGSSVLWTLSPEGILLHAGMHTSASFFSFGLKTAWDVLNVLRSSAGVDWDRLAAWALSTGAPRGFWTPMRLLSAELGLPVPSTFLSRAPVGSGARRIETIARHRLFRATEGIFDLDVLTKAGMMLLLQDSLRGRLRYVTAKLLWRGEHLTTWGAAARRARHADVLRQAWRQYRRYRQAMARSMAMPREADQG